MAKKKLKVALIFGGTSEERKVSLESAKMVAKFLDKKKYQVVSIEISKNGKIPFFKLSNIDVAFIVIHGPGGEDGTIQGMLEVLGIKYTGSGVLASSLAMDKAKTKRIVTQEGIKIAPHIIVTKNNFKKYLSKLKGKIVIKPNRIGSSIGVSVTDNKSEIKAGIINALKHDGEVIIEPFIRGREFTVPVLGNKNPKALPVIEIVPKVSKFFDYKAKYEIGGSDEIVPAPISKTLAKLLQDQSVLIHELIGAKGVTRSDFIVTNNGDIFFLEINTIPGMTNNSLVPKSAAAAGISYVKLLDKIIQLALEE